MRYWLELIQQIPVKNIDFDLENNRKLESNLTNNIVEIPSANYPTTMAQLTVGNITFLAELSEF